MLVLRRYTYLLTTSSALSSVTGQLADTSTRGPVSSRTVQPADDAGKAPDTRPVTTARRDSPRRDSPRLDGRHDGRCLLAAVVTARLVTRDGRLDGRQDGCQKISPVVMGRVSRA